MNLRRVTGLAVIIAVSALLWNSYSFLAKAQKDSPEEKQIAMIIEQRIQEGQNDVYYELEKAEPGKSIPAAVYVKGRKILTFNQVAGTLTPRERAVILVNKLRNFVNNDENPWKIFPGFKNGIAVIKYGKTVLSTADVKSAKSAGMDVSDLALGWANNIRSALGAAELIKDYELIELISDKYDEIVGYYETGVASWYGGYFHGRTAADGSIYNMYKFTAAHKTLPFGSVVKVTNLKNGNSCIVKITDRGPFIDGRIIDLSKVAAEEIDMLDSGISNVKIEVIGKV